MLERFDYDTYRSLLNMLLKEHVNLRFVDTAASVPLKYFILRHDVDFHPQPL